MEINERKIEILERVKSRLLGMLEQAQSAIADAQMEANSHIGAMQSRYDTFKEEAQYLAAAQTIRSIKLEADIASCERLVKKISFNPVYRFDVVEIGAVLRLKSASSLAYRRDFFIVPGGAGTVEDIAGVQTLCVAPDAPIVRPFVGLSAGEEPEVETYDQLDDVYVDLII